MSAIELYETCNSRIPKQKIEECAKLMIDERSITLDQWKSQLLQLLRSKEADLSLCCQMNLLFILNKVILELSSSRATDLFQDILEILISNVVRYHIDESKEIQHILKLIKTWISAGKFPKEFTAKWKKVMEDNQHIPPPPPSGSGIDSSIKGSSRKRVRSRDDVQFENMLESLTSNTSPRNHHHPNRQDWSNFEFPSSTSNNITLSPIILQNKQDQRPEINEFILQMMKVMCKFLKQIFDYLCSVSQSNQEIYHWKTIMHTSFWFLHNYIEYMFVSDDMITLSLACIYLSGKAEHFFIKTDKLRTIAQKFTNDVFGRDSLLPADSEIFRYETKLLQLIAYNVNAIQNPYKQLKIWKDEKALEDPTAINRYFEILEQEAILFQYKFWFYHARSLASFVMLLKEGRSNQAAFAREQLKRVLKRHVMNGEKSHILEVIDLIMIAQSDEILPINDKVLFYNTLAGLFMKMIHFKLPLLPALQLQCPPTDRSDNSNSSIANIPDSLSKSNTNTTNASNTSALSPAYSDLSRNTSQVFNNDVSTPVLTPPPNQLNNTITPVSIANAETLSVDRLPSLDEFNSRSPSLADDTPKDIVKVNNRPPSVQTTPKQGNGNDQKSADGYLSLSAEALRAVSVEQQQRQSDQRSSVTRLSDGIAFTRLNSPTNHAITRRTTITSLTDHLNEHQLDDVPDSPPPPPPEEEEEEGEVKEQENVSKAEEGIALKNSDESNSNAMPKRTSSKEDIKLPHAIQNIIDLKYLRTHSVGGGTGDTLLTKRKNDFDDTSKTNQSSSNMEDEKNSDTDRTIKRLRTD